MVITGRIRIVMSNWQVVAVRRDGRRVTLKENVSREAAESLRNWLTATGSFATVLVAPGAKSRTSGPVAALSE